MFRAIALLLLLVAGPATADPIAAAGRLERENTSGTCSAVLVEPDIVLTAAHCVGRGALGLGFRPGSGPEARSYPVKRVARHPYYDTGQSDVSRRFRFDLAAALLAEPVPEWVAQPLAIGEPARLGEKLFLVSWRRPDGPRPRQRACPVIQGLRGLVTLACPVVGGESGAPVLRRGKNGLELVAVVSSRAHTGRQSVAQASDVDIRLPPLIDRLD